MLYRVYLLAISGWKLFLYQFIFSVYLKAIVTNYFHYMKKKKETRIHGVNTLTFFIVWSTEFFVLWLNVQQHDLSLQIPLLCCIVFICLFHCNTFLLLSSTVCTDLHLPTGFSEEQRTALFLYSSMNSLPVSGNSTEESYSGLLRFDWQLRATPGKVCSVLCVSGGSSRSPQMKQEVLIPSFKMDSENNWEFSFWHLG